MYNRVQVEGEGDAHLGVEVLVALGAGLQGEHQTALVTVQREGEVRQQSALVLHKQRGHRARVLQHTHTQQHYTHNTSRTLKTHHVENVTFQHGSKAYHMV